MNHLLPNGETINIPEYVQGVAKSLSLKDAEVISQDALLLIVKHKDQFKGTNAATLKTWLWRICYNVSAHYRKKRFKFRNHEAAANDNVYDRHPAPEDHLIIKEQDEQVRNAIDAMPEEYKSVFVLAHLDGEKDKEVAERLNITLPCVKSRLYRGKMMLRKILA